MKILNFNFQLSKFKWFGLAVIIIVAAALRLWQLGAVPSSPDWDEVALGYNAYSIIHTGRDEYSAFMPVVMRSYDDYKPALYSYLSIPTIETFGLSVFSVRLPSAIFGILTVIAVYFLVKDLFKKEEISLLISGLLAISPWHIQFSRIAFESNVGLAFNVFGALFFIKGLKRPWLLFFSITSFVASAYVYQSEKVFSPLLIIALAIIFRKQLFKIPKKLIVSVILVGFVLSLPMLWYILTNKNALERAQGVSVFADQTILKEDAKRLLIDTKNHDVVGLVLDNRRLVYAKEIVANYLSHFDFNWLFISGDLARHHAPNMGLMYLWELPFLLLGLYFLLFGDFSKETKLLIFSWFLITPIPASVTTGVPHAVRALNFLPIYQVFVGLGLLCALRWIGKYGKYAKLSFVAIVFAISMFNFIYYIDQYFVQQSYYTAYDWQYGYAKAVPYIIQHENDYQRIVVSNQPPLDQSYMFFLFYLKYDPALYQSETKDASGGFRENHSFGKFEFRPIGNEKESKTLYVGRPSDFGSDIKKLETIYYPSGEGAIVIATNK
ncbi:MAG TPA: glycosyltransferase family 39 protein [Patescibacteria group bacterium]